MASWEISFKEPASLLLSSTPQAPADHRGARMFAGLSLVSESYYHKAQSNPSTILRSSVANAASVLKDGELSI